ncbi:MAG: hypothetical protein K6G51_04865 [Sphaerochaetaceae bacterium]|nr:hypothetical protein [Sphaerochaetaceae bacterium]
MDNKVFGRVDVPRLRQTLLTLSNLEATGEIIDNWYLEMKLKEKVFEIFKRAGLVETTKFFKNDATSWDKAMLAPYRIGISRLFHSGEAWTIYSA